MDIENALDEYNESASKYKCAFWTKVGTQKVIAAYDEEDEFIAYFTPNNFIKFIKEGQKVTT